MMEDSYFDDCGDSYMKLKLMEFQAILEKGSCSARILYINEIPRGETDEMDRCSIQSNIETTDIVLQSALGMPDSWVLAQIRQCDRTEPGLVTLKNSQQKSDSRVICV
jgi:hypothetical protein